MNTCVEFDLGERVFQIGNYFDESFSRQQWDDFICTAVSLFAVDDGDEKTALERLTIFNYLFFNRLHFVIDDNGNNRSISSVVATRTGCAPTVALLYFALASEAGLPILPLCNEFGFVPVWIENGEELMRIDLLNQGNPSADLTEKEACIRPLSDLPSIWMDMLGISF